MSLFKIEMGMMEYFNVSTAQKLYIARRNSHIRIYMCIVYMH